MLDRHQHRQKETDGQPKYTSRQNARLEEYSLSYSSGFSPREQSNSLSRHGTAEEIDPYKASIA
jgi:hypothetical protein